MIKPVSILLLLLAIQADLPAQQYWLPQTSPTSQNLRSVFFADSLNGWIGGDSGTVIHTTNGGQTWSFQNSGVNYFVKSIEFLGPSNGHAVSWETNGSPPDYYGTRILHTSNGGNNWSNYLLPDTNLFINSVTFTDSLHGLMGGSSGSLFYTDNAGATWERGVIDSGTNFGFPVQKIRMVNAGTGFAAGGVFDIAGVIWKTTNGGRTWKVKIVGPEPVNDLCILDSMNVIGVGGDFEYGASKVRTTDGGNNWTYNELGVFGISNTVVFRNSTEGWISMNASDSFLVSTNAGINWQLYGVPGRSVIYSMCFADESHGWAVGGGGTILKYNSHVSGISGEDFTAPENFSLMQNYPNPFNPTTIISYKLKHAADIKLTLLDARGRELRVLDSGRKQAGEYRIEFSGDGLASGIYFYRLTDGAESAVKKMIFVK